MFSHRRKVRGFTLIELVITITILVILVTIAAPSFVDTLDKRRLINATQAVSAHIQLARSIALVRNQEIQLIFDINEDDEWCLGISDDWLSETCDCFIQETIDSDQIIFPTGSCSVGVPLPGSTERMLGSIQSSQFPNITFEIPSSNSAAEIFFEPSRGLLSNSPTITQVQYLLTSPRDRTTRVSVNIIGRVNTCSENEPLLGGIGQCANPSE